MDLSEPSTAVADKIRHIPFTYAKRHGVLVVGHEDDRPVVVHRPQVKAESLLEAQRYLDSAITLREVSESDFDRLLREAYEEGSGATMQLMGDMGEELDLHRIAEQLPQTEDLLESEDDAPIIRLLNALLTEAIKENSSDIHIEPYENHVSVRFRVDGVMREVLQPQRVLAPLIVSRVKVMARLDIAEKRLPQDGRISLRVAGRAVDVRVSTIPTAHGERVVLRLLDKQAGRLDLEHLGMDAPTRDRIDALIRKPHGIILVTGPTGSGKTTTLYAALTKINNAKRNIMTVEDPIEYHLEGVSQTHVNTKVDMSFARGLRAILRQDPDVVMVGEIRDLETAQIGVQASLTGHLVFSTLHTNSAIGAVTRLRDMGVEPFLLSSSLLGVLAQRLVRLLCPECREAYSATDRELDILGRNHADEITLYKAHGCAKCNHTGFRGRSGIYELLVVDDAVRDMIHEGASEQTVEAYVRPTTPSIREDGLRLVLTGETTIDEVLRVSREG
jgi:general secretion pathway protein E